MQEKKWTNLDFSSRTDALAAKIGIDIGELPDVIGFSRASLFAYRGGKASITSKAWRKLEQAEREAGLAPAFEEQFKAASGKEVTQLLESATRKELFSVMPPEVRKLLMEGDLEKINNRMIGLFINTDGLMTTAKDYLAKPRSKEARSELEFFVKKIAEDLWPARKLWDEVYKSIRARLLEE